MLRLSSEMNCALDDDWYILSGFYFAINCEIK